MSAIRTALSAALLLALFSGVSLPAGAQNCNPDCSNGTLNTTRYLNAPPGTDYYPRPGARSVKGFLKNLLHEPTDPAWESPIRFAGMNGSAVTLGDIVNTDLTARHVGQPAPNGRVTVQMQDVQAQAASIAQTRVTLK